MVITNVSVTFPPNSSNEEKQQLIDQCIESIESSGGKIVGSAPLERIYVKIVGREFTVETE